MPNNNYNMNFISAAFRGQQGSNYLVLAKFPQTFQNCLILWLLIKLLSLLFVIVICTLKVNIVKAGHMSYGQKIQPLCSSQS